MAFWGYFLVAVCFVAFLDIADGVPTVTTTSPIWRPRYRTPTTQQPWWKPVHHTHRPWWYFPSRTTTESPSTRRPWWYVPLTKTSSPSRKRPWWYVPSKTTTASPSTKRPWWQVPLTTTTVSASTKRPWWRYLSGRRHNMNKDTWDTYTGSPTDDWRRHTSDHEDSLSGGVIALIIFGVLLGFGLLALKIFLLVRRVQRLTGSSGACPGRVITPPQRPARRMFSVRSVTSNGADPGQGSSRGQKPEARLLSLSVTALAAVPTGPDSDRVRLLAVRNTRLV